jgi:hypothetical protein
MAAPAERSSLFVYFVFSLPWVTSKRSQVRRSASSISVSRMLVLA